MTQPALFRLHIKMILTILDNFLNSIILDFIEQKLGPINTI